MSKSQNITLTIFGVIALAFALIFMNSKRKESRT